MRAWFELLRISLLPTVLVDVCVGMAFSDALDGLRLLAAGAASAGLFCGGMALNGWVDREHDRRTRPLRPLPSGRMAPSCALTLAVCGLLLPPAGAWLAGHSTAGLWLALMSIAIATYHSPVRNQALLGPALLGSIRGMDLVAGFVFAEGIPGPTHPIALCGVSYATYVMGASLVAHQEDRGCSLRWIHAGWILCAAATLSAILGAGTLALCGGVPPSWRLALLGLVLAFGTWQITSLVQLHSWIRAERVEALAGRLLARMVFLPTLLCLGSSRPWIAAVGIPGWMLVRTLVRRIPPT